MSRAQIHLRSLLRLVEFLAPAMLLTGPVAAAMSVTLTPSIPSPAGVGTLITWTASVSEEGAIWYRFESRRAGQQYQVIRDFGPVSSLNWTAADREGWFEVKVSTMNIGTGETAEDSALYQMVSRVIGNRPAVNTTSNPLVFLYSAAPCRRGQQMRVDFTAQGGTTQTPFQPCDSESSMNFYLVGLRPGTVYRAHYVLAQWGEPVAGPDTTFTTGSVPPGLFTTTSITAPSGAVSNQVLLGSSLDGVPVATDLNGAVLWYGPDDLSYITRPETGGVFWGLYELQGADPSRQFIRKFDAAGIPLLETNAALVNLQLWALGYRQITAFHHEVRTLPDGRIAALADVEQILSDVQGPGPVDVIGDMIIIFDSQLNVQWAWDAFDHLDVTRQAVLGEVCTPVVGACAPYSLSPIANDWTHGNSISETPDGQLLYSTRHQDWLIKLAYDNAHGDGHVIWRLGKDGDFTFNSTDSYPWFSHQHDANFETSDPSTLLVFDDGNTRVTAQNSGNSRGQVIKLDERNRVANVELNADLGVYSSALGSAQKLRDGDFAFDAGLVFGAGGFSAYSIEVDASGNIVGKIKANVPLYRSFRLTDLYTPN